jgi:intracellular multiplication protein IcmB
MSTFTQSIEAALLGLMAGMKTDATDLCCLDSTAGKYAMVADNGAICSIIEIDGCTSILSSNDYVDSLGDLANKLTPLFNKKGHALQFFFSRDLDASQLLDTRAAIQRATASKLEMGINDLIDNSASFLRNYVYAEKNLLVVWSYRALLDSAEAKISSKDRMDFLNKHELPPYKDGQDPTKGSRYVVERHQTAVDSILMALKSCTQLQSELLSNEDSLRAIRQFIYPQSSPHWMPKTTENHKKPLFNGKVSEDVSWSLPPRISHQLMSSEIEQGAKNNAALRDPNTIRLGGRLFAPVVVSVPADNFFNDLFNTLVRSSTEHDGRVRSMPFCLSVIMQTGSRTAANINSTMATIVQFAGFHNKNIRLGTSYLNDAASDTPILDMRIMACTWADNDDNGQSLLSLRKSKLLRALESWGAQATERTGRAAVALSALSPALDNRWSIAPSLLAPLHEAVKILPLTRPASPFKTASSVFRSIDGKPMRYQRFSDQQTSWVTLVSGRMGFGKSVLCNSLNFDATLSADLKNLPYFCIIDIGISSSGFRDLVAQSLPKNKQHLARYCRIQNTRENSVNPLDTPLGLRKPLPRNRQFMTNFVTALVTPAELRGKAPERMSSLVGRIIDASFEMVSDKSAKGQPRLYRYGHDKILDAAVVGELGLSQGAQVTYWALVDAFFDKRNLAMATRAQYYAVPTLNNLVTIANMPELRDEYQDIKTTGSTPILSVFTTGVREAVGEYPIFSEHTRFDIGSSRITIFDLQDVAAKGTDSDFKRTSLMYLIARECFMKKIAFSTEDLISIPDKFNGFYSQLIKSIIDENKVLMLDEYHKTDDNPILREQILTDTREGRKWRLEIMVASQLHSDFGDLAKVASTHLILDAGTQETVKWLTDNIGMSNAEIIALKNHAHGATSEGSTMLGIFSTKRARISQLLTLSIPPQVLWALSTSAQDRKLRTLLCVEFDAPVARALLAKRFPNGSCGSYIEAQAEKANIKNFDGDDDNSTLVEELAKEMIADYRRTAATHGV